MLENIAQYFEHISSRDRALILAGGITFFWLLESAMPLFKFTYNKWKHAGINIFFTLTTIAVNFLFAIAIVHASDWCAAQKLGIVQWLAVPLWAKLLIALAILDFIGAFLIHFIEHKIKWMWKFHLIHHADMHVDTTTANRHHPGESVFRAAFTLLAVYISGAPIWMVMLYQSVSVVLSQFNHANIKIPRRLDALLQLVIVTPNMHHVHHHYMRPATDSNYGNIFSFWDRIFKTYHQKPMEELHYGLDVLEGKNDGNLKQQLGLPFNKTIKTDY